MLRESSSAGDETAVTSPAAIEISPNKPVLFMPFVSMAIFVFFSGEKGDIHALRAQGRTQGDADGTGADD